MMKTRILGALFSLYSISAMAGYECVLDLAHTEDLGTVIATKTVTLTENTLKGGMIGTLYVEEERGNKKVQLDVNYVMSGWKGEEDAVFAVIRKLIKKEKVKSRETISDKILVKGNNSTRAWFDSYKLDVSCRVLE